MLRVMEGTIVRQTLSTGSRDEICIEIDEPGGGHTCFIGSSANRPVYLWPGDKVRVTVESRPPADGEWPVFVKIEKLDVGEG